MRQRKMGHDRGARKRSARRWLSLALCCSTVLVGCGQKTQNTLQPARSASQKEPGHDVSMLPMKWQVAPFRAWNAEGSAVEKVDFAGKTWIASFFFLNCQTVCPLVVDRATQISNKLAAEGLGHVPVVLFSVDPVRDTTAKLAQYRQQHPVRNRLQFLTFADPQAAKKGDALQQNQEKSREKLQELAKTFHLDVGAAKKEAKSTVEKAAEMTTAVEKAAETGGHGGSSILHGVRFFAVNAKGQVVHVWNPHDLSPTQLSAAVASKAKKLEARTPR